ncbi:MAG: exodeoxyribonuclease V subunit gamma [Deltaproteobacteria bacterium]|nr:MAG: exodeoxyribonuclease V subunit gamma [Deltaproteobacteria bacterium]
MNSLRLFTSNRMEKLTEALAGVLSAPLKDPLSEEVVIVPNRGVERYLSLNLSRILGVWGNFRFTYPDDFIENAITALIPELPETTPFNREVLLWRIFGILRERLGEERYKEVQRYVAAAHDGEGSLYSLSERLTNIFELYQVFRPEMLSEWEAGADPGDWQSSIWRELVSTAPGSNRAFRMRALNEIPEDFIAPVGSLPERVSLFGVGLLAPSRLATLESLSKWCEVNLFVVNPSRHFWGELLSPKEAAAIAARSDLDESMLHLENANPLLASNGRLGREFFSELAERVPDGVELFETPQGDSLLASIQREILELEVGVESCREADESLSLHSCHGKMREVEVLYDYLLQCFEELDELAPSDILVAAPDIEAYAPYIEAVFGGVTRESNRYIPFSIADRRAKSESGLLEGFLALMELPGSRMRLTSVIDLLECGALRRSFGVGEEDIPLIKRWLDETRVRWGVDGEHRASLGFEPFEENSWRAGLKRLLLGYAIDGARGEGSYFFKGILPHEGVFGSGAAVLGSFAEFAEALFSLVEDCKKPRSTGGWAELLREALKTFFDIAEAEEQEAQPLRDAFDGISQIAKAAGAIGVLNFSTVREHLKGLVGGVEFGGGYAVGRVTFSAMRPLRQLPFRVVALLGMEDASFPRKEVALGFDRMHQRPRRGDPSRREEDRYLFLELLLSARERFYMSFTGQSVKDLTESQPSLCVSELMDFLDDRCASGGFPLSKLITTHERLQGFSPEYFKPDSPLFSYSEENLAGARAMSGGRGEAPIFSSGAIEDVQQDSINRIHAGDLSDFFINPAKYFIKRRLRVDLEIYAGEAEESELFLLDPLDRFKVADELIALSERGFSQGAEELLAGEGLLPVGEMGRVAYEVVREEVRALISRSIPFYECDDLGPLSYEFSSGGVTLTGALTRVTARGLYTLRPGSIRGKDMVRWWINHLILNVVAPEKISLETTLLGRKETLAFNSLEPDEARGHLEELISIFKRGMGEALPIFPEASLAYVERVGKGGETAAMNAAMGKWNDSKRGAGELYPGEGRDPYFARAFVHGPEAAPEFAPLSLACFGKLIERREKRS